MPGCLEMVACRREVARLTTAGRDGVGLARADGVNVEAVEAGREYPGGNGLDGDGGVPAGEVEWWHRRRVCRRRFAAVWSVFQRSTTRARLLSTSFWNPGSHSRSL